MAERKKPPSSSDGSHDQPSKRARLSRSSSELQVLTKTDATTSASKASVSSYQESRDQPGALTVSAPSGKNGSESASNPRLVELLDLSDISAHGDVAFRFGEIARSLIRDHTLVVSTKNSQTEEYELLEVEFYLRKEGHEDPFAHGTAEQAVSGKWYFHRSPRKSEDSTRSATSLTGYRGGTRKGLDLTFGGPLSSSFFVQSAQMAGSDRGARGGILFRSIRRLSDGSVISGPSLLVDEVLRVCGCASIAELVDEALERDTSAFALSTSMASKKSSISIRPRANALAKKPTVYSSPRIGLDLSHPGVVASPSDARVVFVQKAYRYFRNPPLLTSNGRPQTFLGIYNLLSEAEILNENGVLDEVSRLTGIKRVSVEKYSADYQSGKAGGRFESFIGSAGKGASSSSSTYLKMMGSLVRFCKS